MSWIHWTSMSRIYWTQVVFKMSDMIIKAALFQCKKFTFKTNSINTTGLLFMCRNLRGLRKAQDLDGRMMGNNMIQHCLKLRAVTVFSECSMDLVERHSIPHWVGLHFHAFMSKIQDLLLPVLETCQLSSCDGLCCAVYLWVGTAWCVW